MSLNVNPKLAWPLLIAVFLVTMALIRFAAPTFSHPEPSTTERACIEQGYQNAIMGLYRNMFDRLITNPPLDDKQAQDNFKTGIEKARHARMLALEALN